MYREPNPQALNLLAESILALLSPDDYIVAAENKSYGGSPLKPLTPEELERLKGPKPTPPPPGFREQYLPKADTTFFIDQFLV